MGLVIRTTGLEQYAPGGTARIKILVIGGSGVGKTRFASFFPQPIYADCEAGLASVADRQVPYVTIRRSSDMLDLFTFLKNECRRPADKREYETVVIDTLDAYQRKLKAEWMERERKETFTGWEAWGYLNSKLGAMFTWLLGLDMNVVVLCHYKDKTTKDDDTGKETHELMLQLQGEIADTAFNDFDLVGWMGTYWEPVNGERVQKRGLTFQPTPDKPFLKDRLHVTPKWLEVTFDDSDYKNLFTRINERIGDLSEGKTIGEIPSVDPAGDLPVVKPENATSGPLPPVEVPLARMDKPTLLKHARDLGVTALPDGTPIRGNTVKSELIAAIEHAQAHPAPAPAPAPAPTHPASAPAPPPARPAPTVQRVDEGLVDPATGELHDDPPTAEQVIATTLGGQVLGQTPPPAAPAPAPAASAATQAVARRVAAKAPEPKVCQECGKDLASEDQNYVKLAWIKYRAHLCMNDYVARKNA